MAKWELRPLVAPGGEKLRTLDGDTIVAIGLTEPLAAYLLQMRQIAIEQGYLPSTKPQDFDTSRGRRLHRQFWVGGRLVSSAGISQASDSVWSIVYNIAWQPVVNRDAVEFGFYKLLDAISQLNIAWMSDRRLCWTEPINISSATPLWDEDLKAWVAVVEVQVLERRSWTPTE